MTSAKFHGDLMTLAKMHGDFVTFFSIQSNLVSHTRFCKYTGSPSLVAAVSIAHIRVSTPWMTTLVTLRHSQIGSLCIIQCFKDNNYSASHNRPLSVMMSWGVKVSSEWRKYMETCMFLCLHVTN